MLSFSRLFVAAAALAFAFFAVPNVSKAAGLPEGVTIDVLAEIPSMTPGVEKILFRKMTLAPGATWTFTVPAESVCQATEGELEVANQTSGKTVTYNTGDRWSTFPGHKVTLTNTGTVDHVHLLYTLIVAK